MPEKYIPYKFDIWFSSHQIFHIAVLIGCIIHFVESLNLYNEKKEFTCPIKLPPVS
jgi:adiponectin receptor